MIKEKYIAAKIFENIEISDNVYKISIEGSFDGKPGQFYLLRTWDKEPLLSRPISIYDVTENKISFLYQVVGEGTEILRDSKVSEEIKITGPLGNSFPLENIKGKVAVVSGGIGVAPMNYLVKNLKDCTVDFYAGFRNVVFGLDEIYELINKSYISTENGSVGHKGYVIDLLKPEEYDIVLCCGPEIMMNKVAKMCVDKNVPVYVSMEKHMACGIGACLVCTCKTKNGNKRTCKDGPVFKGSDVVQEE